MTGYTPTPDYYNDYIAHFGIKGMKWGKRKAKIKRAIDNNKYVKKYKDKKKAEEREERRRRNLANHLADDEYDHKSDINKYLDTEKRYLTSYVEGKYGSYDKKYSKHYNDERLKLRNEYAKAEDSNRKRKAQYENKRVSRGH